MRRAAALLLAAVAAQAGPGLTLEGEPFLPFRLNRAIARDEGGLSGTLELSGLRWDGSRALLCRTPLTGDSTSAELLFYLDEDIRALELREQGGAPLRLELPPPRENPDTPESRMRLRMRALDPPVRLSPDGEGPARFAFEGADLGLAGYQASAALFGVSLSKLPLGILAGFTLLALAAGSAPASWGRGRTLLRGLRVVGATGAALTVLVVSRPPATLFTVAFQAGAPGTRVYGVVERRAEQRPGYAWVSYAAGASEGAVPAPRVALVGLWTPSGPGIPVEEAIPAGARVRLSSPPVVQYSERGWCLCSRDFVTGWVVHEEP
jgi:hypothetical protein